jgi:hypothetical protein
MRVAVATAVWLCSVAPLSLAGPADLSCRTRSQSSVAFRSLQVADEFIAFTNGGPCARATLTIEIRSQEGRLLYRKAGPLNVFLFEWERSTLAEEVSAFVRDLVANAQIDGSQRPSLAVVKQGAKGEQLTVSASTYSRLYKSGQPLIQHPLAYEGGVYVAFDPVAKRSRTVVQWAL